MSRCTAPFFRCAASFRSDTAGTRLQHGACAEEEARRCKWHLHEYTPAEELYGRRLFPKPAAEMQILHNYMTQNASIAAPAGCGVMIRHIRKASDAFCSAAHLGQVSWAASMRYRPLSIHEALQMLKH